MNSSVHAIDGSDAYVINMLYHSYSCTENWF